MPGTSSGLISVIGAGPGGLAVAMLLAASGAKVRVYESGEEVGGRTSRVTLRDRHDRAYAFDRGPTFFLMPYVLEEIFAAAGRRLTDEVELTRLDPMYRLILGRSEGSPRVVDATQDVAEMARRLASINPTDADNFERFIADNRRKLGFMEPVLRHPMRNLLDVVTAASPAFLPHLKAHLSVDGLLRRYFTDPHVRLAVSFQSKYLGMSPMECPSIFTILPFIEYEYGIWHPRGGCNAIMAAMARVCQEMGVDIRCGSRVRGIQFEGARATGLRIETASEDRLDPCDQVVVNADAAAAIRQWIPADLRPRGWSDAQIAGKRYSCSTYMLYLGLQGRVNLPHHTVYISKHYHENLTDITSMGRLSDDPSMYICNPTTLDSTLAPPGDSALYVLMPTPNGKPGPNGTIDWSTADLRAKEQVLEQMEHRFGISDIRRRVVVEKSVTPRDWETGIDGVGGIQFGATFNLSHDLGQMLHKRVQHRLPSVQGVWFVGGGTHPGSGLPVIFLSSQITARLLCEEVGLSYARTRVPTLDGGRDAERAGVLQPDLTDVGN